MVIVFLLAAVGTWSLWLLASGRIGTTDALVPIERLQAMERAQRISDVARAAERAMFEETLRKTRRS